MLQDLEGECNSFRRTAVLCDSACELSRGCSARSQQSVYTVRMEA